MAQTAYASAAVPTRTGRGTEYEIFARVTHRLKAAATGTGADFAATVRALHDNRTLWTALAADVAIATNELPQALRAQIFYLAEFTTQHTRKVLAGTAEPDVLIEINMSVMRGLRGMEEKI
ncbi:MAG: flagellar biosynthesis regulator FlaF [Albidovulum sp.]